MKEREWRRGGEDGGERERKNRPMKRENRIKHEVCKYAVFQGSAPGCASGWQGMLHSLCFTIPTYTMVISQHATKGLLQRLNELIHEKH